MRYSKLVAAATAAVGLSMVGGANAQTRVDAYTYTFTDDDLLADTLSSTPPIIRGGPRPRRIMLLRPRASFVAELLKSVETL